jgi:hypothetical protein
MLDASPCAWHALESRGLIKLIATPSWHVSLELCNYLFLGVWEQPQQGEEARSYGDSPSYVDLENSCIFKA